MIHSKNEKHKDEKIGAIGERRRFISSFFTVCDFIKTEQISNNWHCFFSPGAGIIKIFVFHLMHVE